MSVFTDWCKENGYDPEGVFVYSTENEGNFKNGDKLTLYYDDNTDIPMFKLIINSCDDSVEYACIYSLTQDKKQMTKNNFPIPPFKLSCGDKPEVRQWLKDNGCVWNSGSDLTVYLIDEKRLLVWSDMKVTRCDGDNKYYKNHDFPEITPTITPSRVTGYSQEPTKKQKLENKIAKLQKKLDAME